MLNEIHNMDCFEGMDLLCDESIDLVVTSPPFNLGVNYDLCNDKKGIKEYSYYIQQFCDKLYRILKVGGRVCIDVPMITKDWDNNKERYSADYLYQNSLEHCGLKFREKIIWNKKGVSNRLAWGSYMKPSCPWIVYPTDVILVYDKCKHKIEGAKESITINKQEFKEGSYGIWWVEARYAKNNDHPAIFPAVIPEKLINFYSYKDAVVLDPFVGIGTTCVVAKQLNRKYIGFEISKKYFEIAVKNIQDKCN